MLQQFLWVMISLFAVIGLTVCLMELLRNLSLRKIRSVKNLTLQIRLVGSEPRVEYLINCLSTLCDEWQVSGHTPGLEILDDGVTPETRRLIQEYCEKNPWVVFTEQSKNDIINHNC